MSHHSTFKPSKPQLPRLMLWLGALIPLVAVLAGAARYVHVTANNLETRSHAESTFLKLDAFAIYQQGEMMKRDAQFNELRLLLLRTDTSLKVCIRHRDTCK